MKEIIREKTITESVYITKDGQEFKSEYEAESHENKLNKEIMDAKMNKIFGEPIVDLLCYWACGSHAWYEVTIENHQDLIDFLSIVDERYSDHWDFGEEFVKEVNNELKNGNVFRCMVFNDQNSDTLHRYLRKLDTKTYSKEMDWYKETAALLETLKKYVICEEKNESENS